jgi:hypothetical protein
MTKQVYKKLVFCQAAGHAAIATAIFNNWQWKKGSRCSPSAIIAVFHTSGLLFLPTSEIRDGKLLVGPGHFQEEHVGGQPHHRYIKAHCRCPVEDRTPQKNTHIADNHGKKLPETIISFKRTVFKLCHSAHLFSNTPRIYVSVQC